MLDPTIPLPDKLEIFYWPYPSHINSIICGCGIGSVRGNLSSQPLLGHFIKFFPLAYWVVWDRPESASVPMQSFASFRGLGIDDEADMVLTRRNAPRVDWPEHVDPDQWLLLNNGQSNISIWRQK